MASSARGAVRHPQGAHARRRLLRPLSALGHKRSYLFEVSSVDDVRLVHRFAAIVRMLFEDAAQSGGGTADAQLDKTTLGEFILKARQAIDHSRLSRPWSPYGMLGPATSPSQPLSIHWTDHDKMLLRFMELWASYEMFSRSSKLHATGSLIVRALDRYDSEFLTSTTGWTFLQEVGWLSPWDIQARYTRRLPHVGLSRAGGLLSPPTEDSPEELMEEDIFAGNRKEWNDVRAYCIDSETATDIDDAVSLERTDRPGECWIHVHVADPGSRIRPHSPLARHAALVPQTAYLPGHFSRMFSQGAVQATFSLAPDRPCLTFSARVDEDGKVLEHKITPGTLKDVIYITGKDVSDVCDDLSLAAR